MFELRQCSCLMNYANLILHFRWFLKSWACSCTFSLQNCFQSNLCSITLIFESFQQISIKLKREHACHRSRIALGVEWLICDYLLSSSPLFICNFQEKKKKSKNKRIFFCCNWINRIKVNHENVSSGKYQQTLSSNKAWKRKKFKEAFINLWFHFAEFAWNYHLLNKIKLERWYLSSSFSPRVSMKIHNQPQFHFRCWFHWK
jgi:hypothetical protein